MKTTEQLEHAIAAAERDAAELDRLAMEARQLPFYGSRKAARIANFGRLAVEARLKAYRLRQELPADHPEYVEPWDAPRRWGRRAA